LREAYNAIRDARARAAVQALYYDSTVGVQECQQAAERNRKLEFEFGRILAREEHILPRRPDLRGAAGQFRDVSLERACRIEFGGHVFERDPAADALASITFDL
ncbi:MAG: hypothetical protein ACYS1C_03025, partial [Planctomycetota bacterium]